jgi:hypothetical protein
MSTIASTREVRNTAGAMLLARAWSAIAGPAQLAATAHFLSPDEQGYAYTFGAMLALSAVFELGLGQVMVNTVAHHAAGCRVSRAGLEGPEAAQAIIRGLAGTAVRWCGTASVLFAVVLGVSAQGLFLRPSLSVNWQLPWLLALASACAAMAVGPVLATLEGLGDLRALSWMRVFAAMAGTMSAVASLVAGLGLWSIGIGMAVNLAVQTGWVLRERGNFVHALGKAGASARLWRREVWPLQWRFALSWLGGYVIFQAIVPLSFASLGPARAGQVGMSMAIGWAIIGVSSIWVNASIPDFARLAAAREDRALLQRLEWSLRRGMAVACALAVSGSVLAALTQHRGLPLVDRVLEWPLFALVLATAVSHTLQSALAAALRSYRREPMLRLVLAETAVLALALPLALHAGRMELALLLYAIVHGVIGLAFTLVIFNARMRGDPAAQ